MRLALLPPFRHSLGGVLDLLFMELSYRISRSGPRRGSLASSQLGASAIQAERCNGGNPPNRKAGLNFEMGDTGIEPVTISL